MVSSSSNGAAWEKFPPSAFDVVTGYFPEKKPRKGGPMCRPLLVLTVRENKDRGLFACRVAYGTSNVKASSRRYSDLVIQNLSCMNQMGLKNPTRFVLHPKSNLIWLPWTEKYFCTWSGMSGPRIGSTPINVQKDAAWILAVSEE